MTIKRRTLEALKRFGLHETYESLRRTLHPRRIAAADTWFSRGAPAHTITVAEALENYSVTEVLPKTLLEIIKPCLRAPAYAIQPIGLLASIILAREYEKAHAGRLEA
jgi:hypothetical protein